MELRDRARPRLTRAIVAAVAAASIAALSPPAPAHGGELRQPPSQSKPPRFYRLSAKQVIRIADRARKVRAERRRHPRLRPTAYTRGLARWQVSYFHRGGELAQVQVDDRTGAILEQWTGPQVAWTMARGYEGAFGRKLNAPYVWLPLCVAFLLPFVDPRRPLRLLHLDLIVLLAFGASHVFFNRGEISTSVPLVYPVLLYLLARVLFAGFRPAERPGRLIPLIPASWLMVAVLSIAAFRIGLNVADSNVIDVGYSGVVGADRIMDGDPLYASPFGGDLEHGETYGPVNYLAYVPFEQGFTWSGRWDDLPAAHGAAIAFDLGTLVGLLLLGRRLRRGAEGRTLGLALAYGWVAYPYTAFALETNSNDSLVALLLVLALLGLTLDPPRRTLSAAARGVALGLGSAAKFTPVALAPLFAVGGARRARTAALVLAAGAAAIAAVTLPFLPDGGVHELYDRTIGYQLGRPSPFSVWGQEPSLEWLQTAVKGAAALLALVVALVPRRKTPRQVAALGAGVLLALQLGLTHWFYLYVVWFAPFVLVTILGAYRLQPVAPAASPTRGRTRAFAGRAAGGARTPLAPT